MVLTCKEQVEEIPLGRAKDLTKLHFDNFKPLYRIKSTSHKTYWLCQCNCGNFFTGDAYYLLSGRTQSCGCKKTEAQLNSFKNSKRYIDLTGHQFGKWKVLEEVEDRRSSNLHRLWRCQCECGKIKEVDTSSLKSGNSKSCGCDNHNRLGKSEKNLLGKTFGELTVIEQTNKSDKNNGIIWKCKCSCGNICYKTTSGLRKSLINSCGCVLSSKGCYDIEQLLKSNNIEYIKEYKFQDCKNINPLPFDYFLPQYNILIEFDGEQHFFDKPHFEPLQQIRHKDMIKNFYCFNNDLTLIRIPYNYTEIKIEDLLINSKYILTKNNLNTYYGKEWDE